MKPVDLHLVSWMRPKMTELVIRAIYRNTEREHYRLVVVDNNSGKATREMLKGLQNDGYIDELLLFPENVGLEPARTYMLYNATHSPYFICIDNDCLPEPVVDGQDWIERLIDLQEHNPEYAAIACRTQVMIGTGNIFEEADVTGKELVEFPHPGGSLRLMNTTITRQLGGWREKPGRGEEERYICGKLREAGHKTGFATNIRTYHLFGIRGEKGTDRWGYNRRWKPKKSGHSNIYHPALTNGDSFEEVAAYAGPELTKGYFDA